MNQFINQHLEPLQVNKIFAYKEEQFRDIWEPCDPPKWDVLTEALWEGPWAGSLGFTVSFEAHAQPRPRSRLGSFQMKQQKLWDDRDFAKVICLHLEKLRFKSKPLQSSREEWSPRPHEATAENWCDFPRVTQLFCKISPPLSLGICQNWE